MPGWYGGSYLKPLGEDRRLRWHWQWNRCVRWYWQVKEIEKRCKKGEISSEDWDVIFAFFQNCFHLRDWVLESLPSLQVLVSKLFSEHPELQVCQDICNGTKHGALNRPRRDADFNIYREWDYFIEMEEAGESPVKYRVVSGSDNDLKKWDLFELATNCIKVWEIFLVRNQLLKP